MSEKECSKCGETKGLQEFVKDKHKKSGYTSACKAIEYLKERGSYGS